MRRRQLSSVGRSVGEAHGSAEAGDGAACEEHGDVGGPGLQGAGEDQEERRNAVGCTAAEPVGDGGLDDDTDQSAAEESKNGVSSGF